MGALIGLTLQPSYQLVVGIPCSFAFDGHADLLHHAGHALVCNHAIASLLVPNFLAVDEDHNVAGVTWRHDFDCGFRIRHLQSLLGGLCLSKVASCSAIFNLDMELFRLISLKCQQFS